MSDYYVDIVHSTLCIVIHYLVLEQKGPYHEALKP